MMNLILSKMKNNAKYSLGLTVFGLASISLTACASGPQRGGPPQDGGGPNGDGAPEFEGTVAEPIGLLFASMDTNSDAKTSKAEVAAGIAKEWMTLAGRGNIGAIVFSDWSIKALGSTEARPTFLAFDENFNSSISKEEFSDRIKIEFERLDANADGLLERSEMVRAISRPQARQQQGGGGGQQGGRGGGGGGGGGGGR